MYVKLIFQPPSKCLNLPWPELKQSLPPPIHPPLLTTEPCPTNPVDNLATAYSVPDLQQAILGHH